MFLKRRRGLSLHTGKNFNFNTHRCENLKFYNPLSIIQSNYYNDTHAKRLSNFVKIIRFLFMPVQTCWAEGMNRNLPSGSFKATAVNADS